MGRIVWLASYPKSGNTWLRAFLKCLLEPRGKLDINALPDAFPYDIAAKYYRDLDPRPVTELTRAETLALRPRVHQRIAAGNPHVTFVKTHSALVIEEGLPLITPEVTAGAIYIVRNPADVAVSFSCHTGKSIDGTIEMMNLSRAVDAATDQAVSEHFGSWSENVASWTKPSRPSFHVVRYEDMIVSPAKAFASIAQYLQVPASREHLDRAIKQSSFRVLREQERRAGFIERPASAQSSFFRVGKPGGGLRALSRDQLGRLVGAHRDQMFRFGYLPAP
jgi:hypothetical protein